VPQPYPGQRWKHGWIPLTPDAATTKNHGRPPKPGQGGSRQAISKAVSDASELLQRLTRPGGAHQATDTAEGSRTPTSSPRDLSRRMDEAIRKAAGRTPSNPAPGMRHGLRHSTDADGVTWANQKIPLPDLTEQQRDSIRKYTGASYDTINPGLRGDPPETDAAQRRYRQIVSDLDSAIAKSRLPEPVIVYRGVGQRYAKHVGADIHEPDQMGSLVGRDFTEPGYMSTSVGSTSAFDEQPVQLMLRVPAGHPALNVMSLSGMGEDERELLVSRNTRYIVHAAYQKNQQWFIEAEVVPNDWIKPPHWTPDPYGDAYAGYVTRETR
jgi:hypothetical protein